MALAPNQIRIGAQVAGRVGSRRFAGTVTSASAALIGVTGEDGVEREVCPAWADPLVVDGVATPMARPIPTLHVATATERQDWRERKAKWRQAKALEGDAPSEPQKAVCELCGKPIPRTKKKGRPPEKYCSFPCQEKARAVYKSQQSARWRAKHGPKATKQQQEDAGMKLTKEESIAKMQAAKRAWLAKPIPCLDCKTEFVRNSPSKKRCQACQAERDKAAKKVWAANSRARKMAALEGDRPLEPAAAGPAQAGTPNGEKTAPASATADRPPELPATPAAASEAIESNRLPSTALDKPIPAAPPARRYPMVPLRALEAAHGQIQTLWKRIADLEAQLAARG